MFRKVIASAVILLFVSVGYIPCINGNSDVDMIESRNVEYKSRIEELSNKLLELKALLTRVKDNDCGCDKSIDWDFPIICSILLFILLVCSR